MVTRSGVSATIPNVDIIQVASISDTHFISMCVIRWCCLSPRNLFDCHMLPCKEICLIVMFYYATPSTS